MMYDLYRYELLYHHNYPHLYIILSYFLCNILIDIYFKKIIISVQNKNNLMKKMLVLGVVLFLIAWVLLNNITVKAKNDIEKMEKMIGTKVIFEKDTLSIINYSFINKTCKLSNNQDISFILAERLQVVK